jgi:DNA-binding NtrC family response regulator
MGMMLKSADYEVTTAHDGEGALSVVKAQAFDLAVVDLKLPGMDGISFMRELHQINPEMPVIILTAHSSVKSAVEAIRMARLQLSGEAFRPGRTASADRKGAREPQAPFRGQEARGDP